MIYQAKAFSDSLFWLCSPALIDLIVKQAFSMKLGKKQSLKTRLMYCLQLLIPEEEDLSLFQYPYINSQGRDWLVCLGSCAFYCTNHLQAVGIGYFDWPGLGYIPTRAGRRACIPRYQKLGKDSPRELQEVMIFESRKGGRNARKANSPVSDQRMLGQVCL